MIEHKELRANRHKLLAISTAELLDLMTHQHEVIANPLPVDARIVGQYLDHSRGKVCIELYHPEFELVPDGDVLPWLVVPTYRLVNAKCP